MTTGDPSARASLIEAAAELLERSGERGVVRLRDDARSMEPTLRPGQTVAVEFAPRSLRVGDLLLFRQADYLVVHRLLGRSAFPDGRAGLRTRGDARPGLDPRLAPADVVGRVVAAQRPDGAWIGFTGGRARAWARAAAWHDLAWAAAGVLVRPLGARAGRAVAALDRSLLQAAHRLLFAACHRAVAPPVGHPGSGAV